MITRLLLLTMSVLTSIWGPRASAEIFQNSYISFELPVGWTCQLEQTEWVCVDKSEGKQNSAIMIFTAKERGSIDRFDLYEDHLSTPRPLLDTNGNPVGRSSRVIFVKSEEIGKRTWIHGRQFESELANYYTDYFAIVDEQIAILVTFAAHISVFERMFARFYPTMATIQPKQVKRGSP